MKTTLAVMGIALLAALIVLGVMELPSAIASAEDGLELQVVEVAPRQERESVLRQAVDPAEPGVSVVAMQLGYRNDTSGFQLLLPESWECYQATTRSHRGAPAVFFWFDKENPTTVFQVYVHTHDEWERLQRIEGHPLPRSVAQTDESVFCYSLAVTADEDPFIVPDSG